MKKNKGRTDRLMAGQSRLAFLGLSRLTASNFLDVYGVTAILH